MSDGERERGRERERELASKTFELQSKRFHVDVRENHFGRFLKISEVLIKEDEIEPQRQNRRNRLLFPMSTAVEFRDHVADFNKTYESLGPANPEAPQDRIKSATIVKDNRRYYLDLKENNRGYFLRASQTIPRSQYRSLIAVPAEGLKELSNLVTLLLDEFGPSDNPDDGEGESGTPQSRQVRTDEKTFYFDVGNNRRGIFMRISEVRQNLRMSVTLPDSCWAEFRDVLNDFVAEREADLEAHNQNDQNGAASSSSYDKKQKFDKPNFKKGEKRVAKIEQKEFHSK